MGIFLWFKNSDDNDSEYDCIYVVFDINQGFTAPFLKQTLVR